MTCPTWTDARVEQLERLWLSGLSAAQVAAALGGVTRNAVIGKLHRLGLAGRAGASAPGERPAARARGPRNRPAMRQPRMTAPSVHAPAIALVQPAATVSVPEAAASVGDLAALDRHACRWPIGDPAADDFGFCSRAASGGGPYCPDHDRRAHRGPASHLESDPLLRRLLGGAA